MFKQYITISSLLLLTGCVAIPDPVVYSEKFFPTSNARPEKVLLIIDISLEYPYLPSGLVYSKEDNMNDTYGKAAKVIVKKLADQGVNAEYILHTTQAPLSMPTSGYSHILVEKLDKVTNNTSYTESYLSYRTWTATLLEISTAPPLKQLYYQIYTSDGVDCFSVKQYASKEQCQSKYIDLLLSHLSVIGIKNNTETKAEKK
jgi:hypothetical protein